MSRLASVLLVDDDSTTNFLNRALLLRMEVAQQVLTAENGEQALRTLGHTCLGPDRAACPQLILLDMNMPVLNGLGFMEAYAQLRLEQLPIVIVMLTTSLHPIDQARAQELPIAGFLTKPLTKEKVTALLREHFAAPHP
jgi:CheY-like chemotaxis protein